MLLIAETAEIQQWLYNIWMVLKVLLGFSVIIFFHELGHFLAAKWVGIRVNGFAVGFGPRLIGYRSGEGVTFGNRPEYNAEEIARRGFGETDYSLRLLPIGGYVKMLGQDDVLIDEETNEIKLSDDPRAFPSRPVGQRMLVVSAGVIFNLIFAAVLLTGVFLIGRTAQAPEIGLIPPDSPAHGKLVTGDKVLEVNGRQINSFKDLLVGSIIAGKQVSLTVERDGKQLPDPVVVPTTLREEIGLRILLVDFPREPVLAEDIEPFEDRPAPKQGDRIVAVNGKPISNYVDIDVSFMDSHGQPVQLTVERPVGEGDDVETVTCYQKPMLRIGGLRRAYATEEPPNADNTTNLLGFIRRQGINRVLPDSAADEAGFEMGDIIVQFGAIANPLYHEIISVVDADAGKPIPVKVLRGGEMIELQVVPRRRFQLFSEGKAQIGVEFRQEDTPIVAAVMDDTPAATLEIPRGARIVGVNDVEVKTWSDVTEQLLANAGQEVVVKYVSGSSIVGRPMQIPSSMWNELGFDLATRINTIDGEKVYKTVNPYTKNEMQARFGGSTWAIREYLREKVGQTVEVSYRKTPQAEPQTVMFTVTADNVDPWQGRVGYQGEGLNYRIKEVKITADGNPAVALGMGVNEVKNWILEVYAFLRSMISRENVTVEHVSGPVGIVSVAVERAKAGMVELLYFIAFLSVNLAVINFLPIPVMDGGQMVFLLIEKVKGKPLSLQTQIASTLVGLAAILLLGLIVTFQDIGRLFQ